MRNKAVDNIAQQRWLLDKNGFALSKTFGRSMRPLIWGGQHCVVVTPLEGEPRPGDLLMFEQPFPDGSHKNIVHRLVEIRGNAPDHIYVTRGDNCLGCEMVKKSRIIGRVVEVHRISGYRPWHAIPTRRFTVSDRAYKIYTRFWNVTWRLRRILYIFRAKVYGASISLLSKVRK